ncbi:dihydrolipoyllysine-residue acetyltransferase component of pyruvate dehydrogenase complex [Candidatus Photodesmus blepharus]|uniref:Dihydrolipoamide acetyltransferase component of pyruvate dehydrogenase complex n=1 Tax=Candidatus Photodesmus blepharonis TaxID=1179155 RepID=A0A084CP40_9GAMM|nr:dihydrolipoyllysine-residue acetyltransferase component of pyruvate dehydrogenase complex [Candidatus Photodesmus blepharus]
MEIEINVPDIGADEVEVIEILVNVGDEVEKEQSLATVEGDKASMELPAPFPGIVKEINIAVGDKVSAGSLIMIFISEDATLVPEGNATIENNLQNNNDDCIHSSPVVRRLAREFGVDLSDIKGTGRKGRILKEDIQLYVKKALKRPDSSVEKIEKGVNGNDSAFNLLPWPKVDFGKFGEIETKLLSRVKKISGANLHRNWVMIPHVTQWDSADITELEMFRKEQNIAANKKNTGLKITLLPFVMKAVAKALELFPRFNSSLSDDGGSLILKKYVNIGIAVDTPDGLVVPVFQDVNKKGIYELSEDLVVISQKARAGRLTVANMQGGCFTISSLGGIGGSAFTPIINAPEVGILGISKSEMQPVWDGKEFQARLRLPLSLSYDHRVIDGVEGAQFITFLNSALSDIRCFVL